MEIRSMMTGVSAMLFSSESLVLSKFMIVGVEKYFKPNRSRIDGMEPGTGKKSIPGNTFTISITPVRGRNGKKWEPSSSFDKKEQKEFLKLISLK
jgi:hypothetical protein